MKPQTRSFLTPATPRREISHYLANQERISRGGLNLSAAFPFLRVCRYSPPRGEGCSPEATGNCSSHCFSLGDSIVIRTQLTKQSTAHQESLFLQGDTGGDNALKL